jgi:histidinol phosphatase-like enzyme (inositol monophosphatase family)
MAPPCPPDLLDAAVAMVREAGELTLRWFRTEEDLVIDHKHDDTPVTEADRGAERLLRDAIEQGWPDDHILGEEEDDKHGTSGRRWIIDPIDGTKAFTRGVPMFTNLLGVEDEDGPLLGVINMPALGETVYAGRGRGCFVDGRPCWVSNRADLAGSTLTATAYEDWPDAAYEQARHSGLLLRGWGDGYGYALVASGRAEAMVDFTVAPWDLGPMPVVLAEAGGRFTDLQGGEGIDGGSGLATNGHLHDELLRILRSH